MDEVFTFLKCSKEGLSSNEAQTRAAMFGPNKLEERKVIIDPILFSHILSFIHCLSILKSRQILICHKNTSSGRHYYVLN